MHIRPRFFKLENILNALLHCSQMLRHVLVVGFSNYFNGNDSNPFGFVKEMEPSYKIYKADTVTMALTAAQHQNLDLIITNYHLRHDVSVDQSTKKVNYTDVTENGLTLLMNLYEVKTPKLLVTAAINPLLAKKAIHDFQASGIYEFPIINLGEFRIICDELIDTGTSRQLEEYHKKSSRLQEPNLQGIILTKQSYCQ